MACASAASFFWRLTNGLTQAGAINRTSWPEAPIARPKVMGAPAGLHSDDAAWMLGKKSEDFIARKFRAERHAAISAGAIRLKAPLCQVETDNANFFHGCPLHSWDAQTSPPWHIATPSGGGIHSTKRTDRINVAGPPPRRSQTGSIQGKAA